MTGDALRLPEFTLDDYTVLLHGLRKAGYELAPVGAMPEPVTMPTAYLRHDIDLHVTGVDAMAEREADLDAQATYYVMVSQHYNPGYPPNALVLRHIKDLGHEIGLHYDLSDYPSDAHAARARLDHELDYLQEIIGCVVTTISMHQPGLGGDDPFRHIEGFVHPHDPNLAADLLYVSDSCRAWRDESLLTCLRDAVPRRLLLLTHPEVWLAPEALSRMEFLDTVLRANVLRQHEQFIDEVVRGVWERHPGPALHDRRQEMQHARSSG